MPIAQRAMAASDLILVTVLFLSVEKILHSVPAAITAANDRFYEFS